MIAFTATCASCGKPLKSITMSVPIRIKTYPAITPTLSNCQKCGARGARIYDLDPEVSQSGL